MRTKKEVEKRMRTKKEVKEIIKLIEMVLKDNGEIIPLTPRLKSTLRAKLNNCYWILEECGQNESPTV